MLCMSVVYAQDPPSEFEFNQSTAQSFYSFSSFEILDIEIDQDDISNLIFSLIQERLFFDYATYYKHQNPSLDSLFIMDDTGFNSFVDFLGDKSYDYKTRVWR